MTDLPLNFSDDLNALDYILFRGESNPSTRSAMVSIMMLDKAPDFETLTRRIDYSSRVFVRMRQKVIEPSNFLIAPRWAVDPDFDLDYHLRRVRLPESGSQKELLDLCEQISATPFDMTRSLWEFYLVDGLNLPDSKSALIVKIHHAVSDGIGMVALLQALLDFERAAAEPEMPLIPVPEEFSAEEVTKQGMRNALGKIVPTLQGTFNTGQDLLKRAVSDPLDALGDLVYYAESAKRVMGTKDLNLSPLLKGRSLKRDMGVVEVPLADLRRATKSVECTVNDGLLAAVSLALGKYHREHNVEINQISASMPVNKRAEGNNKSGNYFSAARLQLPLGESDPVACMQAVSAIAKTALAEPAINLVDLAAPVLSRASDSMMQSFAGDLEKPEIQISNVPGVPVPTYITGCKLTKMYPFGPVPNVALMVGMVSYNGTCFVGLHSDRAAIKDFDLFERCLNEAFDQITSVTKARARKSTVSPVKKSKTAVASKTKRTAVKKKPASAAKKAKKHATKKASPVSRKKTSRRAKEKIIKVSARQVSGSKGSKA